LDYARRERVVKDLSWAKVASEIFNNEVFVMFSRFLKNIIFLTLPSFFILFIGLELFFRFVIPASEKPIAYFDEENSLLRSDEKKRTEGTYTIGKFAKIRAKWRTNNYGWNSAIDYHPNASSDKKLISIIGDSFVRALQVDVDKNFAALLRNKLPNEYEVYSFGHDGAPLSQYLHMSRYVNKYFKPHILVFLLIHNDFDESVVQFHSTPYFLQLNMENSNGKIDEVRPTKQNFYQFLTYSAIFRYLYSNHGYIAQLYFGGKQNYNANVDVDFILKKQATVKKATNILIKKIKDENTDKRIIFLMDAPRNDIYSNKLPESNVIWMNEMVRQISQYHHLELIDLTNSFYNNYTKKNKKFNSELDFHWDEYGHSIVSDVLYQNLTDVVQP